jgi:ABC-type uncharacterized transport system substrate-binding protein
MQLFETFYQAVTQCGGFMKKYMLLFFFSLTLFPFCASAQEKIIFVIESYHAEYPWDISYKEGLREVMGSGCRFVCFQMDTKRLPESEYERMAEQAWKKYQEIKPDLVILGDDNALRYLAPKFGNTDTPVVYLGINRNPKDYGVSEKKNITGVLERPLLNRSIASIQKSLRPEPGKILVLFDSSETSEAAVAESFKGRTTLPINNMMVQLKLIGKLDEWKNTVLNAKAEGFDAIIIGLYHTVTDEKNKYVSDKTLLKWTVENTPVPPFGFWDFSVGADKTVGGFVLFGKAQGEAAGKIALKILSGKSPQEIRPVIAEMGKFLFSRSQLKKWGLTLPNEIASAADYVE